uniref:Uncharacterized protein n=1 Tax=Knipowitschia caucasica TaxID=637954 RepID=A0AAV2LIB7_KNICA
MKQQYGLYPQSVTRSEYCCFEVWAKVHEKILGHQTKDITSVKRNEVAKTSREEPCGNPGGCERKAADWSAEVRSGTEKQRVRMQQSRPLTRIHPLSPRRAEHLSEPVRLRPGAVDWVGVGVPREAEVLAT